MILKCSIKGIILSTIIAFSALQADYEPFGPVEQCIKEAIQAGNIKDLGYYIAQRPDLDQQECHGKPYMGKTLLSYAINSGSVQAVAILLKAGACVEVQSDLPIEVGAQLQTCFLPHLSYAIAVRASLKMIKLLIKYSKDLNICDLYHDRTAYEIARYYNRADVMRELEKAGAKITKR